MERPSFPPVTFCLRACRVWTLGLSAMAVLWAGPGKDGKPQAAPAPKPAVIQAGEPWDWHLQPVAGVPASWSKPAPDPGKGPLGGDRPWKGSAVVVIWGDAEPLAFKDFKRILVPALVQASWAGYAGRENVLQLGEFMAQGDKYRTPTAGAFWYNCLRPSRTAPVLKPRKKFWEILQESSQEARE